MLVPFILTLVITLQELKTRNRAMAVALGSHARRRCGARYGTGPWIPERIANISSTARQNPSRQS